MILSIRTEKPVAEIGLHQGAKQIDYESWEAHRKLSDTLLAKIDTMLTSHELDTSSLSGIVVYKGPGSFTGLRIGITVANTLSYGLDIPVVADGSESWIRNGVKRLEQGENEKIALPEYGGEANITKPRK